MAKASSSSKRKAGAKPKTKRTSAKASTKRAAPKKANPVKKQAEASSAESTPQPSSVMEDIQLPATSGKVGVFGGPKDRGIKPDDKLALPTGPHSTYERVRSLNPKSFYCAMRWDYRIEHKSPEEGKRWWANKKIMVTNPKNGASVVVRAVDYGPHENTGLDIAVSPGAAEALGVEPGDEVEIAFADQKTPTGLVNE
jgi:hypothetical protein